MTDETQAPQNAQPQAQTPVEAGMTASENAAWDSATKSVYVSFANEPTVTLMFAGNGFRTVAGLSNKQAYEFAVKEVDGTDRILSTQSVRLMNALRAVTPLAGKTIQITRTGEAMNTNYSVLVVG